jgi:NAD(P)H-dependent flavin oxidoreductase YrpB (nitropropane dioxygenase family)
MVRFIFFLTYSDVTVYNALDVFDEIKDTGINFVGFKDVGLPEEKLKKLVGEMKKAGKTTFLEVVSATKEDNIRSTKVGVKLGVDYLIGGTYVEETFPLIKNTGIKYFPYIGKIVGHPCLLRGTIEEIAKDARRVEALGANGIDLLAYRYDGDVERLIKSIQKAVKIPLIIAGSIDSFEKVRKMAELGVWAFTIGGAVFDKKFAPKGTLSDQISAVLKKIEKT